MIDKLSREFMGIVRHLLGQDPKIKNDRLLVPRETLIGMLDKHPYLTATDKLTAWRDLRWLDADAEHFTRLVRDGTEKRERVFILDLTVYEKLCELREMPVD